MKISHKTINKILKLHIAKCNLNRYIKNHYPLIYKQILKQTSFLSKFSKVDDLSDISIFERFYCINNNLHNRPLCKNCGSNFVTSFNKQTLSYRLWCSPKCQATDKDCIDRVKKTKLNKYGNENYNGIEKSKNTRFLKNNGSWHSEDFSKKVKSTKFKNFGNENYVGVEKIKNTIEEKIKLNPNYWTDRNKKIIETKIKNGHDKNWNNREKFKETLNNFSNEKWDEINEKRKATNLERYGYDCTLKNPEFRNISVDYYMENFGVCYKQQTDEFKENYKNKMLQKYGVSSLLKTDYIRNKNILKRIEIRYNYLLQNEFDYPLFDISDFGLFKETFNKLFKFKCKKCGNIFESYIGSSNAIHDKCPKCFPRIQSSNGENEIYEFICSFYNGRILKNTKNIIHPFELDIFIPELKIAIEYDGIYWHNSEFKDKMYHLNKTLECEKQGIQLIHIFENEWLNSKEIVKSRLKSFFNIYDKKIYARLCSIEEIDNKSTKEFLKHNHIQGYCSSNINIALKFNNYIVSIMTFSKSRISKKYEYELVRFCNKTNTTIIGGASKLLKYFEKKYKPKSIVSYADRRWSKGNLYKMLKFNLEHISKPNYWYFKHSSLNFILESRIKYQKHKLHKLLPIFDNHLSEYENMKNNDYLRIFDCGNYVFYKNYE